MNSKTHLILLPEYHAGFGTGHLFRAFRLLQGLAKKEPFPVFIVVPLDHPVLSLFSELKHLIIDPKTLVLTLQSKKDHGFEPVILIDKPFVSIQEAQELMQWGKILGLDSGGPGRKSLTYLVDTLPNLYKDANLSNHWILPLPEFSDFNQRSQTPRRVLVSLGGEDSVGLTKKIMGDLMLRRWLGDSLVDVLVGPASRDSASLSAIAGSWQILAPIPNLSERVRQYSLVITIFGLTAFESLSSGTPVLLVHPTEYHKKLTRAAGLPELAKMTKKYPRFSQALGELQLSVNNFQKGRNLPENSQTLIDVVEKFVHSPGSGCPICGTADGKVIHRTKDRTFFACPHCGLDYQQLACPQPIRYSDGYFLDDYKKQYGKTYLDDFSAIAQRGISRISTIKKLMKKKSPPGASLKLLDIGCAYGPFLSCAEEAGFVPYGIDVSETGIQYVKNTLGYSAWVQDIRTIDVTVEPFLNKFDVVTLWYVIEHFEDLRQVLPILGKLVKPGGVLALATPSGHGITRKFRGHDFFTESPFDHYSIWNPRQARSTLSQQGFTVKKILCPSFHPDRYPWPFSSKPFIRITKLIQKFFILGDTIEIYTRKKDKHDR